MKSLLTRPIAAGMATTLFAGLLMLAATATAQDFSKPVLSAHSNSPGCITVSWSRSDMSGVHHFEFLREDWTAPLAFEVQPPHYHTDCGLTADTEYRYQVCAVYATEDQDTECESISERTRKTESSVESRIPPTPMIVSHHADDTWIGIRWEAGHDYDSYFINISENVAQAPPKLMRTIHHDDDGNWGYQRVEGLRPGQSYHFEVQGCTEPFFGILVEDNCWGWSTGYDASTTGAVRQPLEQERPPPPLPPPPAPPTGCRIPEASPPVCGGVAIECDRPLPVADEMLVRGGAGGIRVYRVVYDYGLINAEYSSEGAAELEVCAKNRGGVSCGNRFPATLGPTFCPRPPVHRACPSGLRLCGMTCISPGETCHHQQ